MGGSKNPSVNTGTSNSSPPPMASGPGALKLVFLIEIVLISSDAFSGKPIQPMDRTARGVVVAAVSCVLVVAKHLGQ